MNLFNRKPKPEILIGLIESDFGLWEYDVVLPNGVEMRSRWDERYFYQFNALDKAMTKMNTQCRDRTYRIKIVENRLKPTRDHKIFAAVCGDAVDIDKEEMLNERIAAHREVEDARPKP